LFPNLSRYDYRPETKLAMCRASPLIDETYFEQGRVSIGCLEKQDARSGGQD
jgi:hypothetical protein